jgi:hypothetical protein
MKGFSKNFQREREIFWEKGILLKLSIHGVQDVRGVRNRDLWLRFRGLIRGTNANARVIPPENINPVRKVEGKTRRFIGDRELKVEISGFHYVPKSFVLEIMNNLKQFGREYKDAADTNLIRHYGGWVKKLRKGYEDDFIAGGASKSDIDELHEELDLLIPTRDYLKEAFFIEYYFAELSPPYGLENVLSPPLYQEELKKFFHMMGRAAVLAKVSLIDEMLQVAMDAEDRLGYREDEKGEIRKRVFHRTLVDNFKGFWALVPQRDIFEDEKIKVTSQRMQDLMAGDVDGVVSGLRENDKFRKNVRCELGRTRKEIALDVLDICRGITKFVPDDIIQRAKDAKAKDIIC